MPTASCDFCNEFSGKPENAFRRIYAGDPENRILFRSDDFVVIPSLGQIVEGYLLVVPVHHWTTLGDLPDSLTEGMRSICGRIGVALLEEYGPYIFFEHGTRSANAGGCGIYHAHLHAAPLAGIPDPIETLKATFPYKQLARLNEIGIQSGRLPSYLLYQDSEAALYLFDTGPLPSQYMRKLLADRLQGQHWDWRTFGREGRLLAAIARLSGRFDTAHSFAQPRRA